MTKLEMLPEGPLEEYEFSHEADSEARQGRLEGVACLLYRSAAPQIDQIRRCISWLLSIRP